MLAFALVVILAALSRAASSADAARVLLCSASAAVDADDAAYVASDADDVAATLALRIYF
jgi:hypothetical protein